VQDHFKKINFVSGRVVVKSVIPTITCQAASIAKIGIKISGDGGVGYVRCEVLIKRFRIPGF